ncbi:MAG: ferric reductase-like transmembrane domain-containing protein [Alphaproteobacteria bacterium]
MADAVATVAAARSRSASVDREPTSRPGGPSDRVVVLLATLLNAAFALAVTKWAGNGREGTQLALRLTARLSFAWFTLAFLASPLHALRPCEATHRLLRMRRALGITFGLSMAIHVGFILRLFVLYSPERPPMVTDADFLVGIPGLLLVAAMTLTSADRVRRRLDPLAWKRLHVTGLWVAWAIFFLCLVDSLGRKETNHPVLAYGVFIATLVASAALRLAAWRGRGPGRLG